MIEGGGFLSREISVSGGQLKCPEIKIHIVERRPFWHMKKCHTVLDSSIPKTGLFFHGLSILCEPLLR